MNHPFLLPFFLLPLFIFLSNYLSMSTFCKVILYHLPIFHTLNLQKILICLNKIFLLPISILYINFLINLHSKLNQILFLSNLLIKIPKFLIYPKLIEKYFYLHLFLFTLTLSMLYISALFSPKKLYRSII
jgi:hypothetical protein